MKTNDRFQVTLPVGWEDRTVHYYMGPDDSGVQHALTLTIDHSAQGVNLQEYARERLDAALNTLQNVEILKDEGRELAGGRPAHECVYKWIPSDDRIIFRKLVFMMIDGTAYTFSADFSKKTIKTIGVEADRIIESFIPAGIEAV
jgi:hypothetical protein